MVVKSHQPEFADNGVVVGKSSGPTNQFVPGV